MTTRLAGAYIEWLILADAAQVVGNKLYLMGGGWDSVTAGKGFPLDHQMAVVLSILIPWHETNRRHTFEVEIATEDGVSLAKIGGQMDVGQPQGLRPGSAQRSQVAMGVTLRFEKAGGYYVRGSVNGGPQSHYPFNILPPVAPAHPA